MERLHGKNGGSKQCAKYVEYKIPHTMWKAESMRAKIPQFPNLKALGCPQWTRFGFGRWSFTTIANKTNSLVTKRRRKMAIFKLNGET